MLTPVHFVLEAEVEFLVTPVQCSVKFFEGYYFFFFVIFLTLMKREKKVMFFLVEKPALPYWP